MGTIIDPTTAATVLEEQRLGYTGCSLTNFDNTSEPQIVGNLEIAGSLGSFASAESITGWSGLSNGDVYIKIVPDTGAGTVAAEFTATAPTWDDVKQGWYGTGGNANHRYLFKLEKTGASGYENKQAIVGRFYQDQSMASDADVQFNELSLSGVYQIYQDLYDPATAYAEMLPLFPNVGDKWLLSGGLSDEGLGSVIPVQEAERVSSTKIELRGVYYDGTFGRTLEREFSASGGFTMSWAVNFIARLV